MPRFDADPSKVSTTIEVLEKGDYEFTIGEPKAFFRTNSKGGDSYGVRYPLTVAEGPKKGTRIFITNYQQSEGAQAMGKRFQMAALGYKTTPADEKRFDNDFVGQDWSFDTDSGACGDVWRSMTGKRVIGSLDVSINEQTGDPQQVFKGWRPIGT